MDANVEARISLITRLARALDTIWVLTWQNFTPRNRRERSKLVWVFLEPLGQIVVLMMIFTLIGRTPGYGRSFALFLLTGVVMLTIMARVSGLVRGSIVGLSATSRPASEGMFHEAFARTLFYGLTAVIYTFVLVWGVGIIENVEVMPSDPFGVAAAFFWVLLLGFGLGLIRGWFALHIPPIDRLYGIMSRGLIFISGVFFVPSFMPPQIRDLMVWNPLMHVIESFRLSFYHGYPSIVYDPEYLRGVTLAMVTCGMGLLWRARARVMG
jgi:capsular polysaccharide transport system permease protein